MFNVPGKIVTELPNLEMPIAINERITVRQKDIQKGISIRNAQFFETEAQKLDGWSDDLKSGLEREIKVLKLQNSRNIKIHFSSLLLLNLLPVTCKLFQFCS